MTFGIQSTKLCVGKLLPHTGLSVAADFLREVEIGEEVREPEATVATLIGTLQIACSTGF